MVISRRQAIYLSWMSDVLVYIVVLNLFVEYSDGKVIDSFTISILTAVLLKGMLDLIMAGKQRVLGWSRARTGLMYRVLGGLGVWAILFFSKFVILDAVDFVFGDRVTLGDFVDVLLLVAGMTLTRAFFRFVYQRLGSAADDNRDLAADRLPS